MRLEVTPDIFSWVEKQAIELGQLTGEIGIVSKERLRLSKIRVEIKN